MAFSVYTWRGRRRLSPTGIGVESQSQEIAVSPTAVFHYCLPNRFGGKGGEEGGGAKGETKPNTQGLVSKLKYPTL